jgi:hypothetical protein
MRLPDSSSDQSLTETRMTLLEKIVSIGPAQTIDELHASRGAHGGVNLPAFAERGAAVVERARSTASPLETFLNLAVGPMPVA